MSGPINKEEGYTLKVGVLGDAFIDRYHVGKISGLSAEAPIPTVKLDMRFDLDGGAGNVRANLRGVGLDAVMLVKPQQNYPIKNRLMAGDTQLARWDEEDYCHPISRADLLCLVGCDAIVVADYCKGSVSEEVIQVLRGLTIPVFVDTKGDPRVWLGSNALLFPNWKEYNAHKEAYNWFPKLILKRGSEGVSVLEYGRPILQCPSLATTLRSVNGAGDSAMAGYVAASLSGFSPENCLKYAMATAAVACGQPYTTAVTYNDVASVFDSIG